MRVSPWPSGLVVARLMLVNRLRVWVGLAPLPIGAGPLAPGETSIQSAAIAAARCAGAEQFRRSMGREV